MLARDIGSPLNTFVTIAFAHTGASPTEVDRVFGLLRNNHFKSWLAYRRKKHSAPHYGTPTFAWAKENSTDGAGGSFPHVHWLVHIPEDLKRQFPDALGQWLERLAPPIDRSERVIEIKPIGSPQGLQRYCLKDLSPRLRKHFQVPQHFAATYGMVFGKRIGVSQNLGPAAQMAWIARQEKISNSTSSLRAS
jgi:hypothetical protein